MLSSASGRNCAWLYEGTTMLIRGNEGEVAMRSFRPEPRAACSRAGPDSAPPPPGLPRWSEGFCTRHGRSVLRPHRACPGGAMASAPERRFPQGQAHASPGQARWEAAAVQAASGAEAFAPPGQARWGRAPFKLARRRAGKQLPPGYDRGERIGDVVTEGQGQSV